MRGRFHMENSVAQRGRRMPLVFLLCLVNLLCWNAPPMAAQFDTGTLNGTTVESSGAVIPNASVTVSNTGTGQSVQLTSNAAGAFSASALPFGTYTVSATAPGFGKATSKNIVLNVG